SRPLPRHSTKHEDCRWHSPTQGKTDLAIARFGARIRLLVARPSGQETRVGKAAADLLADPHCGCPDCARLVRDYGSVPPLPEGASRGRGPPASLSARGPNEHTQASRLR